jgi:glycosyltransferase involved in cell wall biosynthesis
MQKIEADDIIKNKRVEGDFTFSILVPTWNNLAYLKLCIESIRKNSFYKHQLIVHINEGIDGSVDWIKTQADIDYTYSSTNIGICYALNAGRSIATTNYILYINDDMYVCPNWDKELMDEIQKIGHPYFFLSSTAIEPVASSNCAIEKNFGTDLSSFKENELLEQFDKLEMQDWTGSTWPPNIVHKDIWDLVGGYSIEFSPGMYSDPDFSMKLWLAGIKIFKGVSKSRVYHFGSKSVKRVKKNKGYYTFISKWKISSSTVMKYYLKRGNKYEGAIKDTPLTTKWKIKNFYKRLQALFKA